MKSFSKSPIKRWIPMWNSANYQTLVAFFHIMFSFFFFFSFISFFLSFLLQFSYTCKHTHTHTSIHTHCVNMYTNIHSYKTYVIYISILYKPIFNIIRFRNFFCFKPLLMFPPNNNVKRFWINKMTENVMRWRWVSDEEEESTRVIWGKEGATICYVKKTVQMSLRRKVKSSSQ